jgi:UDP-3-O-[3-hydroxymyristoyl] glucosamine N-acyltransferase
MQHPGFFQRSAPISLADIAKATGSNLLEGSNGDLRIEDLKTLSDAGPHHLSFLDNRKYLKQLAVTEAGACFVQPANASRVPAGTTALVTKTPYRAFAQALQLFYPDAMWSKAIVGDQREPIAVNAVIEEGVHLEAGAVVGPEARIGRGSRICSGAVIGYRVMIGRDCYIGPNATITHALIGDRVILHSGVRVGQDGFGFAMGRDGHLKVPQVGRVIIQDSVEIGANTCIDRGALKDTVIGEGTKIDNLVQIGHNVIIGRHCVIAGHTGISGSTEIGDFVAMGGQSGTVGHIKIGSGAQIAGASHPKEDVDPGAVVGGTPARPFKQWARELALLARMANSRRSAGDDEPGDQT